MRISDRSSDVCSSDLDLPAPEARIIWRADIDPATLPVVIANHSAPVEESIELGQLLPWLRIATDTMGREPAVLSDGLRHLRIDIVAGRLIHARGAVLQLGRAPCRASCGRHV